MQMAEIAVPVLSVGLITESIIRGAMSLLSLDILTVDVSIFL